MENREAGLVEIYTRIKEKRADLGVKVFKRTPTKAVTSSDLICILMIEGDDTIIKRGSQRNHGYPAQRVLEVTLEIIARKDVDIGAIYRHMRKVVFTERNTTPERHSGIVAENVFINENHTEGPMGFGMPNVIGMRLVLDLVYTDKGL